MRSPLLFGTLLTLLVALVPGRAYADKPDAKKGTPAPAPPKEVDENKDAWSETSGDKATAAPEPKAAPTTIEPPAETWDINDVQELPGKRYFFVGLRYRGNVIPSFLLNAFVDEGKTIFTNMIGAEFDIRKDGFSLVPALSYHELGTGDLLFKQKNTKDIPGNYSLVNSGMKVVYASVDLLWSSKISKNVEFEYGAGFGLGAVFGDLENSWVQEDPSSPLAAANGKHYSRCNAVAPAPGTGCHRGDHQDATVDRVNGYQEKSWFSGGSKPALFPWIAIPQLGLRIKPIKNFVGRIGVGFALTGFWFGLNAQYGLEKKGD